MFNLLCNSMVLWLTRYVMRLNTSKWKLFFGAIVASCFLFLQVYLFSQLLISLLMKILFSIIIIIITFGYKGVGSFFRTWTAFYFISFALGGGILGVHYLLNDGLIYMNHKVMLTAKNMYGDDIHLAFILICFPLIWLFIKRRMDDHVRIKIKYDQLYEVILTINGQSMRTKGYLDSGNHLVDPITRRPVVLCDMSFLKAFFPQEDWIPFMDCLRKNQLDQIPLLFKQKVFIVPFQGVGGKTSYLYCLKPELLTIFYQGKILETNHVLVGIQLDALTENNAYHCLLHPQLIHFSNEGSAS